METNATLAELLKALRRTLEELYGERLHAVILYGSHARGEAADDSDVDVMVVLDGPVDPWEEIARMAERVYEMQLAFEKLISTYPVSLETYQTSALPVLVNARREGIPT